MIHFGGVTQSHTVQPIPLQQPWFLGHQEPRALPDILPRMSRVFIGSDAQQLHSPLLNLSHKHQCLTIEKSKTGQHGQEKEQK